MLEKNNGIGVTVMLVKIPSVRMALKDPSTPIYGKPITGEQEFLPCWK